MSGAGQTAVGRLPRTLCGGSSRLAPMYVSASQPLIDEIFTTSHPTAGECRPAMCETCRRNTDRPWWRTTSGLVVLLLGSTLLTLASVADTVRLASGRAPASADCARAASVSIAYQSKLTRDRAAGADKLVADTNAFANGVRGAKAARLLGDEEPAEGGSAGISTFCRGCAARLALLGRGVSAGP